MLVEDLMTAPVVSLLADQPVPLAGDIMRFKHIRHLPVVDTEGHVVGLVSHRDLLRWADLAAELRRERRDDLRVDQMMTRGVWTVRQDMPAADVGRTMLDRKLGCAPVVDADGRIVGIVTDSDFLRVAVAAIEIAPIS
jgi:CBS domain-containing protein